MSYTVLARKYRSQTLDDLVGQGPIATTLKNAVRAGRVHHGYLFTGTRGVGKTSSARLLAKSLNCLASGAPTPNPCCACESCRMIAEGEDLDVIEIDAASNRGVENIRDLRENTVYRPARSRYKIYIIDEVHMLTSEASNALLKTLEEPPDHVKFILATTEIQKVPATIVSRCQRFDFKSISIDDIAGHLAHILRQENVETDDAVIRRVARLANGSMRDGLSLLDQLLSFGGGKLTAEVLEDVLPVAHDEVIAAMVDCVADEDAAGALGCVERSLTSGQTMDRFCEMTINHLRTLMLLNVCGAESDLIDVPAQVRSQLVAQSKRFDAATYVYMISLTEDVRRAVKSSGASRALVDAAVVKLALAMTFSDVGRLLEQIDGAVGDGGGETGPVATPTGGRSEGSKGGVAAIARQQPAASAPAATAPAVSAPAATARARVAPVGPAAFAATDPTERPKARRRPPAAAPSSAPTTVNSEDAARARRDPKVQQAMELFDGTLINVHRAAPAVTRAQQTENDSESAEQASAEGDA